MVHTKLMILNVVTVTCCKYFSSSVCHGYSWILHGSRRMVLKLFSCTCNRPSYLGHNRIFPPFCGLRIKSAEGLLLLLGKENRYCSVSEACIPGKWAFSPQLHFLHYISLDKARFTLKRFAGMTILVNLPSVEEVYTSKKNAFSDTIYSFY